MKYKLDKIPTVGNFTPSALYELGSLNENSIDGRMIIGEVLKESERRRVDRDYVQAIKWQVVQQKLQDRARQHAEAECAERAKGAYQPALALYTDRD